MANASVFSNGKIAASGGSHPVFHGNEMIGAYAISGATSGQDEEIAEYAAQKVGWQHALADDMWRTSRSTSTKSTPESDWAIGSCRKKLRSQTEEAVMMIRSGGVAALSAAVLALGAGSAHATTIGGPLNLADEGMFFVNGKTVVSKYPRVLPPVRSSQEP